MANPRKFSEKIALQKQKQAEGTAEFEKIMKEVSDATSKQDDSLYNQRLAECGVPNATTGRESRGRSVGVGPMRRPSDRRVDRSPYSSGNIAYLSPPSDSFWRRASSDSAIHQSLIQTPEKDPGSHSPLALSPTSQRRSVQMNNSINNSHHHHHNHHHSHESRRNNLHNTNNRNSSNIDIRQGSPCGINNRLPCNNMYTSSHDNSSTAGGIGNNTGSLPDLTSVHFSSSLNKQLVEKEHEHSSSPYSSSPLTTSPTTLSPTSIPNRYQYSPAHSPSDSNTYSPTHFSSNIRQNYLSVPGNESSNHHFSRKNYNDTTTLTPSSSSSLSSHSYHHHNNHHHHDHDKNHQNQSQTFQSSSSPLSSHQHTITITTTNWDGNMNEIIGNCLLKEVQFDDFRTNQMGQTSHLSFTNLPGLVHVQNNSSKSGNISNNSIHGSHGHLSSIGIAAAGNLTEYRNPQSRPSPGSSPGLIPSMSANESNNPSAPCSPVPQNFNNSNSQTYDKYQSQNNDAYNLNPSFHNHFEQFSLDWATLFQSLVEAGCTWTAQVQVDNSEQISNLQTAQNNFTTLQFNDNAFTHLGSLSTTNSSNQQQPQSQQQQQTAQQQSQQQQQQNVQIQQLDQDNYNIQLGGGNIPVSDKRHDNLIGNTNMRMNNGNGNLNSMGGVGGGSGGGPGGMQTTSGAGGSLIGSPGDPSSPHHHHQQQQQHHHHQQHQQQHQQHQQHQHHHSLPTTTDTLLSQQQQQQSQQNRLNHYQTPNTPTSIPEIVFSDFSTSNADFSKEIFGPLDLELGPMDVVGLQMLSDPNSAMIADPTIEDSFRQDLN